MNKNKPVDAMVDVGAKEVTHRTARAEGRLICGSKVYDALTRNGSPKGDVWESARVAAILAAKATPQIVPHCHPLPLDKIRVQFEEEPASAAIRVAVEVSAHARTGVEMEALTAVSAALLTVYDMMKWADKGMRIERIRLLRKTGGRSGDFAAEAP